MYDTTEGTTNADTPRPERVTLTDEEALARLIYESSDEWDESGVDWQYQYGSAARQARAQSRAVLASDWLAAREQALREEIAGQIEAKYLGPDSGRHTEQADDQ